MPEEAQSVVIAFRWVEQSTDHVSIFTLEDEQKMWALAESLLSRLIDGQIQQLTIEREKELHNARRKWNDA
jgi:hypothetical protein